MNPTGIPRAITRNPKRSGTREAWRRYVTFVALALCLPFIGALSGCEKQGGANSTIDLWKLSPTGKLTIRVTGEDFRWHVLYAGPDGMLDTEDDITSMRHVHVPAGTPVEIQLRSHDYIYTMELPHLKIKEIAVPDLFFGLDFATAGQGDHELLGSQMCGYTHKQLVGRLIVHTPDDYNAWLRTTRDSDD